MNLEPPEARRVQHDIAWRALLKIAAAAAGVWLLLQLWPILVVIVVALVLVGTVSPIVAALERRMRRGWALAIVFGVLVICAGLLGLLTIPVLGRQLVHFLGQIPQIQAQAADALAGYSLTAPLAEDIRAFQPVTLWNSSVASGTLEYSRLVAEGVGYGVTTLFLAIYLLLGKDSARGVLYAWVPRAQHMRLARILERLETIVGGYMRGQLVTSAAIAAFTFLLLTLCGVPNALALAVLAGFADVVPFVGGLLATAPAVIAALPSGLGVTLVVLIALVVYQEFENRVLVPRIYGRVLRLSPAAVIIALLVGGNLLGIIGALLALPVAAAIRMIFEEMRVLLPGDDSDTTALHAQDAHADALYAARSAGASPGEAAAFAAQVADEIRQADALGQPAAAPGPPGEGGRDLP